MHAGEAAVDGGLVSRLVAAQFPQWAALPLTPVRSAGTVNVLFRLGDDLVVRLPRVDWSLGDIDSDATWLPRLAPLLPVAIPSVVAVGAPDEGFPWPWAIYRWLPGDVPVVGGPAGRGGVAVVGGPAGRGEAAVGVGLADPRGLAADLAGFVRAMRAVDLPGAPAAYRGGGHSLLDPPVRKCLPGLDGLLDPAAVAAVTAVWNATLAIPDHAGPPTWLHGDLLPGNLLVDGAGRLSAVIDFATLGVGDPSCDLIPAWAVLPPRARAVFREAVAVDDATWLRGRGRALAIAVIALPYYHRTNPAFAATARYIIGQTIADSDITDLNDDLA